MSSRETRAGVLHASDVDVVARETRVGVLYAADPLETLSARFDIVVGLTANLTTVPAEPRITAPQRLALQQRRAAHWLFVSVRDADGTYQDLGTFGGNNYVLSAVITSQLDTPATSATITVAAGEGADSIAPLMTAATANTDGRLIDVARDVRIQMAVTGYTANVPDTPDGDDIITIFLGTIDRVSSQNGQTLTLSCRDKLVPILDGSFDRTRTYGDGVTPLEMVLQDMLDDALGTSAPTLLTRISPAWAPPGGDYAIVARRGESLWQKMLELTDQIGWLVRYKWNGAFISELVLFEPDRLSTTAKYTLQDSSNPALINEVREVQEAALDLAGVRNSVQIAYYPTGSGTQAFYTAQDSSSIAAYRKRPLIISELKSSQINSALTAQRMGDAILPDVALPSFTHTVRTTHAFWPAEPGDIIAVPGNDVTHDAEQKLAVTDVTVTLENGGGSTTMQMRGQPASKGKAWLRLAGAVDDPDAGVGTPGSIDTLSIANSGSSGSSGSLSVTWTGTGLPVGGFYRVRNTGYAYSGISALVTPATSPQTFASGVYTDGIAPPGGKIGPSFTYVTVEMCTSTGDVVATRSQLSSAFYYL